MAEPAPIRGAHRPTKPVGPRGAAVALATLALAIAVLVALPSVDQPATESSGHLVSASLPFKSACPTLKLKTPICHVIIIFLENQNVSWVLHHAPFQEYLAKNYAFASQYYSVIHYSYPNYVAATSGTQTNLIHPRNVRNVVDLIHNATGNMTWGAYYEDMPVPCDNTTGPNYRIAHNPFVFYSDIWKNQPLCKVHDVNLTNFYTAEQAGHIPNYVFIGPNDTHSCWQSGSGERVCDPWLRGFVSPMVNSTFFNSSAIFVTYDEGLRTDFSGINGTKGGGHIYTAVVSPWACKGFTSSHQYNHYNLLTTTEWLLNLGRTGYNDSWNVSPPMYDMFCFPNGTVGAPVSWVVGGHALSSLGPTPMLAVQRTRDPEPH